MVFFKLFFNRTKHLFNKIFKIVKAYEQNIEKLQAYEQYYQRYQNLYANPLAGGGNIFTIFHFQQKTININIKYRNVSSSL